MFDVGDKFDEFSRRSIFIFDIIFVKNIKRKMKIILSALIAISLGTTTTTTTSTTLTTVSTTIKTTTTAATTTTTKATTTTTATKIHRIYGSESDDPMQETVEPIQLKWEHTSQLEDGKLLIYWSDRVRFIKMPVYTMWIIFPLSLLVRCNEQFSSDPFEVSNTFEFEAEVEAALTRLNDDLPCMM